MTKFTKRVFDRGTVAAALLGAAVVSGGWVHVGGDTGAQTAPRPAPKKGAPEAAARPKQPVEGPVLDLQDSFANVAAALKPAVVSITSIHVETEQAQPFEFYFGDPFQQFYEDFMGHPAPGRPMPGRPPVQRKYEGMGSGVIISPDGYILTNEHVIHDAADLKVTVMAPEEKTYTGKVVGKDPRTDLAVIKISAKEKLAFAVLGDSDKARVGDWAIAVGSPFGLEQTVTVGIVSAVRQSLNIEGRNYNNLIQTDAAINRGNSGGPLINIRGEVIGVNTAIYAPTGVFSGVGFAIPSNRAKDIMDQLIAKGRVIRGWMGVEIVGLTDVMAREFGLKDKDGVLVNQVMPGSPAEKAGLRRGDVIHEFDGKKVANQESLIDSVTKTPPSRKVKVSVTREGAPMEVTLVTGEMPAQTEAGESGEEPPAQEQESASKDWNGARLTALTPDLARRFAIPSDVKGVVVARVEQGEAADEMGLTEGDVIATVNKARTPDLNAFMKTVKTIDLKDGVLLDVYRQGRWLYLSYQKGE